MFSQLFDVITPVFICAALGFAWQRRGGAFDTVMVTKLVTHIGTPCLIISTLGRLTIDFSVFWTIAGAALASIAIFLAIGWVVIRLTGQSFSTFGPCLGFGNSGNLGLPLCLFAFGDAGLALAIAWFTVGSIGQFTVGQFIAAGRFSFRQLLRTPVIYAVAVALFFPATGTALPIWLANTVEVLGGFAIPLMLIALGVSLASLRIGDFGRSLAFSALRMVMGITVGVLVAEASGLEGAAWGVIVIEASMPAAVFNYLWAAYYQRDAAAVAGVVFLSTLMAFAMLPLIIGVALDPTLLPWR